VCLSVSSAIPITSDRHPALQGLSSLKTSLTPLADPDPKKTNPSQFSYDAWIRAKPWIRDTDVKY
jgi:hypothetical protein